MGRIFNALGGNRPVDLVLSITTKGLKPFVSASTLERMPTLEETVYGQMLGMSPTSAECR